MKNGDDYTVTAGESIVALSWNTRTVYNSTKTFVTTRRPWIRPVYRSSSNRILSHFSVGYPIILICDFDLSNRWGTRLFILEKSVYLSSGVYGESTQSTLKIFEGRNKICSWFSLFNVIFSFPFQTRISRHKCSFRVTDTVYEMRSMNIWIHVTWGGPCCLVFIT